MAAEEEVLIEVEAAESVYGDDCIVITQYPPHLNLQIKPRTAEVSSQQFVEATIGIRASYKYPDELPEIMIIDSKGLDEQRQNQLITSINNKAQELSSNSMLVALCEEAVEKLTSMNHPDGDCPLCLSPLLEDGASNDSLPFMKLMSCFHCFHCECIIRWWNWLQTHKEVDNATSSRLNDHKNTEDGVGTCPVCRKVFHAKDIDHVLDLVGAYSQLNLENTERTEDDMVLHSDSEKARRKKFETLLNLQQENNGLIEPKKTEVLMPGMFLPRPTPAASATTAATSSADKEAVTNGEQKINSKRNKPRGNNRRSSGPGMFHPCHTTTTAASTTTVTATTSSSSSSNTEATANGEQKTEFKTNKPGGSNHRGSGRGMFRPRPTTTTAATATTTSSSSNREAAAKGEQEIEFKTNKASGSNHRGSGPRNRYRGNNSRTQVNREWIVKDNGNAQ